MTAGEPGLLEGPDGRRRCFWAENTEIYRTYHDTEWGFPVADDHRLFEKLSLEDRPESIAEPIAREVAA